MQHIANNLVIMGRLATRISFESKIVDLERLMRARRAGSVENDAASACSNRPGEQGREPTPLVRHISDRANRSGGAKSEVSATV